MAGSTDSSDESFRVRVSLERFFSDERARCYVSVRGARRVRWLARRLRRLFALPRRLALLSRGHLLPPDEPLALLRPDDPVEVVQATVEIDQSNDVKNLPCGDSVDAGTSEMGELSPGCKKRRKIHVLHTNGDLPDATDMSSVPPTYADQCTHNLTFDTRDNHSRTEISQEVKLSTNLSSPKSRTTNNQLFPFESNPGPNVSTSDTYITTLSATTENIQDQDNTEPELSDSERIRVLKERALAVLDEVATRPRRRVRVRRRRKRPPPPPHTAPGGDAADPAAGPPSLEAESTAEQPRGNATDDDSIPEPVSAPTAQAVGEMSVQSEGSTREDEYGSKPLSASEPPAVLRNAAAAPRAARLVPALAAHVAHVARTRDV